MTPDPLVREEAQYAQGVGTHHAVNGDNFGMVYTCIQEAILRHISRYIIYWINLLESNQIKEVRINIHKIKLLPYLTWPLRTLSSPPDHTIGNKIGTCTE